MGIGYRLGATHRAAGQDLSVRRFTVTTSRIRAAVRLIEGGEAATQVARELGIGHATHCIWRRVPS